MSVVRKSGSGRSLLFVNALLLSTALALPAMAQIEEVVVTAQKRTEDVQSVPISVTAFTGDDLKQQNINQVKDLQFHTPNVTYTAGNFGSSDFQIRGIGVTAVGYDSESGVAIDFDEVYLAQPQLTEGAFFDLSGLEVLAGPQSTLYGRGATGGVVNVNIAKPDLSDPMAQLIGTYGNYDAYTVQGIVNLPIITDQLGIRIAGEWDKRDGFVDDIVTNTKVDSLDQYSVRSTLRWQPSQRTTIDVTGAFSKENDSHMRGNKQVCDSDPTGVLGCLPGAANGGVMNNYSNLSVIGASQQGLENLFASYVAPGVTFSNAFGMTNAQGQALAAELGLFNLNTPNTLPAGYPLPNGARQVATDFTPVWRSQDNFLSLKWQQNITPWLDSTAIFGYDHTYYLTQESYNNVAGLNLPVYSGPGGIPGACFASLSGSPNLTCASAALLGFAAAAGGPAYAANFAPYFAHPGELPISQVGGLGITSGNYKFTSQNAAFDQDDQDASQYSIEWRMATSFKGPFNAMLGVYYLHTSYVGDYYVNAPTLDYPAIVLGVFEGLGAPGACLATGCIASPTYYHNVGANADLTSKALFGEVYYDAIPDTLKFTVGLRYTDDLKTQNDRILLWSAVVPIGTPSENAISGLWDSTRQEFREYTGRAVADWTPKLSFTDQTLVYASYARGYKAGGANPGLQSSNATGVPLTYAPEFIDAYEVGTKNQLLGNTLQANGDVYYYNYTGLQVSAILNNTSINQNINAHMWGAEGSFLWAPTDRLQFGLNIAHEESDIINTALIDTRNPTGGDPKTVLIKDDSISATTGSNCVVYYTGASMPTLPAGYMPPPAAVGGLHALASSGIANAAFGSCQPAGLAALQAAGFSLTGPNGGTTAGEPVSLNNNALQNTPDLSIGLNAQYTQPLPADYALVARVDFHWQTHFWTRIWEDPADRVGSQTITNASLQLNSPDDVWYAQAFIKNIFNANNVTGAYLTAATSGLYTNEFLGDPRTYGMTIGVKLN